MKSAEPSSRHSNRTGFTLSRHSSATKQTWVSAWSWLIEDSDTPQMNEFCDSCAQGKTRRQPFPKARRTNPTKPFEIVSSDIKGPILEPSKEGFRYYISFNCLLQKNIKHLRTIPYSPEQNGQAERRNQTIMAMARCILIESKLPYN